MPKLRSLTTIEGREMAGARAYGAPLAQKKVISVNPSLWWLIALHNLFLAMFI